LSSANAIGEQQQSLTSSDTQIGSAVQQEGKGDRETQRTVNLQPNKTAKTEQGETFSLF